jgi:hypothetical protein
MGQNPSFFCQILGQNRLNPLLQKEKRLKMRVQIGIKNYDQLLNLGILFFLLPSFSSIYRSNFKNFSFNVKLYLLLKKN